MVIYGWKNLLDRAALERDPIAELVRIYKDGQRPEQERSRRSATPAATNSSGCRLATRRTCAIWNECVALSKQEFEAAYEMLDIHYDIQRGESFYNDRLPAVVDRLLKSGVAEISEGAVCVFFRDIPELAERAVHHAEKRRRLQLRDERHGHRRLSHRRA